MPFLMILPTATLVESFMLMLQPTVRLHPTTSFATDKLPLTIALLTDNVPLIDSLTTDKLLTQRLSIQLRTTTSVTVKVPSIVTSSSNLTSSSNFKCPKIWTPCLQLRCLYKVVLPHTFIFSATTSARKRKAHSLSLEHKGLVLL